MLATRRGRRSPWNAAKLKVVHLRMDLVLCLLGPGCPLRGRGPAANSHWLHLPRVVMVLPLWMRAELGVQTMLQSVRQATWTGPALGRQTEGVVEQGKRGTAK